MHWGDHTVLNIAMTCVAKYIRFKNIYTVEYTVTLLKK